MYGSSRIFLDGISNGKDRSQRLVDSHEYRGFTFRREFVGKSSCRRDVDTLARQQVLIAYNNFQFVGSSGHPDSRFNAASRYGDELSRIDYVDMFFGGFLNNGPAERVLR